MTGTAFRITRCVLAGSDKSGDDVDERFSMSHLPNLTATQMVEALSDWDGVDNTLAVFQDLMIAESGIVRSRALFLLGTIFWTTKLKLVSLAVASCLWQSEPCIHLRYVCIYNMRDQH